MNLTYDILNDRGTIDTTRNAMDNKGMAYTLAVVLSPRGECP